jgi:hypothetical protein
MPNTPTYGIPYPSGSDAIEGTFIQKIAESANSLVNTTQKLTTKGDIVGRSTATTRIPVGTNGSYLITSGTADADRVAWDGSFAGTYSNALELIASSTATGSISFTNIPSTYSMLILRATYSQTANNPAPILVRFNSNSGSVYKSAYGKFNDAFGDVSVNAGTFTSGTSNYWYAGQGMSAPDFTGTAIVERSEIGVRSPDEMAYLEAYFPEYAGTGGTYRLAYATSSRANTTLKPDYYGQVGSFAYFHFAEPVLADTYIGRTVLALVTGVNAAINSGASAEAVWDSAIPLNNSGRGSRWLGSDKSVFANPVFSRSALGGTTTVNLSRTARIGIRAGDTFIISNQTGTYTGINGTWVAATSTTSGTSIITYVSGVAGTIASVAFSADAELKTITSMWSLRTTSATTSDQAAPATAVFSVGGTDASAMSLSSVRYLEGSTAISSLSISSSFRSGSIFSLYGVK